MKVVNIRSNKLETEGTDSDSSIPEFRNKHLKNCIAVFIIALFCVSNSVNANSLYLFSDNSSSVVGTLTTDVTQPMLIEGYIENNVLEAIEVKSIYSTDANSDGTGGTQTDANSDGTGGTQTNANSDGTGGTQTNANSDGTGGTQTDANSDGTGESILTLSLSCNSNAVFTATVETTIGNTTLNIDQIYLDNQVYNCL